MPINIAINGFGRIGRPTFRRILENHPDLEVKAINDLTDNKTLAHLLKYDSIYGRYEKEVRFDEENLIVEGKKFRVFGEKEPEKLPWKDLDIDIVLECTGVFRKLEDARKHITAGAKKVIISAPGKSGKSIPSYILGVNEEKFDPEKDEVVDMGSCTTNCLAPIVKVLEDYFKIKRGFMTTVHSYTNDQRLLDLPHKDLRRARAAALNIIPTTTGATEVIGRVVPEVEGKLDGMAMRIPTPIVSIIDLVVEVEKPTSVEEVNKVFREAAKSKRFQAILKVVEEELVSSDFIGDSYSSIVDLSLTMVKDNLIKVIGWYDNEYAYACRLAEFAEYVGKKMLK